jgi:hypothetical protein
VKPVAPSTPILQPRVNATTSCSTPVSQSGSYRESISSNNALFGSESESRMEKLRLWKLQKQKEKEERRKELEKQM